MKQVLRIDPRDNVAVALRDLPPGTDLGNGCITTETIPAKHKAALTNLEKGAQVRMYGVTVGTMVSPVAAGGLLTTENLQHQSEDFSADRRTPAAAWTPPSSTDLPQHFDGFHRSNGKVGTANHWIVAPLVFCENRNVNAMRDALVENLGYASSNHYAAFVRHLLNRHADGATPEDLDRMTVDPESHPEPRVFPQVDGVKFLTHGLGCGGTRADSDTLCGLLAGYITHPNVAGATILGLGCQNATVEKLQEEIAKRDPHHDRPLHIYTQQKAGTERALLNEALKTLIIGLAEANELQRQPAPLSQLTLGLECGGSDGLSGISANPTLGQVSDLLVGAGGSTILAEFPELCGVEQELINRAVSDDVARRFESLMRHYAAKAEAEGSGFHMNPSPGNIADGLITDAMKSAGAAKKGGTSPVVDTLDYPELVRRAGLNLLCTPGGDVESTTAMVGAGANVVLFTTGLGTPTGNPICPTLKISSNSELARRMPDIIDFDTGPIITGDISIEACAKDLLNLIVDTASGRHTAKAVGLNQDDFLPWKRGVSL